MKLSRNTIIILLTSMIEDVEREGEVDDDFADDPEMFDVSYEGARKSREVFLSELRELLDHVTNGGEVEVVE